MPHKHKRRQKDDSTYDLPPSVIAKSLPVRDQQTKTKTKTGKKEQQAESKNKNTATGSYHKNAVENDTPKAFRRLMQFNQTTGKRAPSGPETDDQRRENKKRKRDAADSKNNANRESAPKEPQQTGSSRAENPQAGPKILPGEKLSDFAARVDRELPLSDMKKSAKPGLGKVREDKQTKHEKHLRRLQRHWREEDARIREREEAERDEREEEMEDQLRLWKQWEAEAGAGKAKKKAAAAARKTKTKTKTKTGRAGDDGGAPNSDDDDPDPWTKLKKRDRARQANPFDVAQAPPQLTKPREIFKVRGGAKVDIANVPAAVGSLRRREELAGERRNIVEEYRRLMAEKRQ